MLKKYLIIFITILFPLTFVLAQNLGEPHFGLCGPTPSQDPTAYQYWLASGARIIWWGPQWKEFIGSDGKLNFAQAGRAGINLEKEINIVVSQGGTVVLHLHTGAGWEKVRADTGEFGHKQSSPPKNMQEYYDFIYQFVQHFKGRVKYYEIENEPYLPGTWSGTNEEYFQLLKTAYQAAHAADPQVKITNGGIALGCLITYKINELVQQGKIQEAQEAQQRLGVDLYVTGREMRGSQPESQMPARQNRPTGPLRNRAGMPQQRPGQRPPNQGQQKRESGSVQQFVNSKNARRIINFMDYLFKEGHKYIDIFEFHAYADYQATEEILAYTKSKMKQYGWANKPMRMKVGWDYRVKSNEYKHAEDVVKIFSVVFGGGVEKAIWFTLEDSEARSQGLLAKAPGGIPMTKPAYNSLKLSVEKLEGFISVEKISLGQDVYAFKFFKANKPVYVLWSETNKVVDLPFTAKVAKITDIYGRDTAVNVEKGKLNLELSSSPIFVEEG